MKRYIVCELHLLILLVVIVLPTIILGENRCKFPEPEYIYDSETSSVSSTASSGSRWTFFSSTPSPPPASTQKENRGEGTKRRKKIMEKPFCAQFYQNKSSDIAKMGLCEQIARPYFKLIEETEGNVTAFALYCSNEGFSLLFTLELLWYYREDCWSIDRIMENNLFKIILPSLLNGKFRDQRISYFNYLAYEQCELEIGEEWTQMKEDEKMVLDHYCSLLKTWKSSNPPPNGSRRRNTRSPPTKNYLRVIAVRNIAINRWAEIRGILLEKNPEINLVEDISNKNTSGFVIRHAHEENCFSVKNEYMWTSDQLKRIVSATKTNYKSPNGYISNDHYETDKPILTYKEASEFLTFNKIGEAGWFIKESQKTTSDSEQKDSDPVDVDPLSTNIITGFLPASWDLNDIVSYSTDFKRSDKFEQSCIELMATGMKLGYMYEEFFQITGMIVHYGRLPSIGTPENIQRILSSLKENKRYGYAIDKFWKPEKSIYVQRLKLALKLHRGETAEEFMDFLEDMQYVVKITTWDPYTVNQMLQLSAYNGTFDFKMVLQCMRFCRLFEKTIGDIPDPEPFVVQGHISQIESKPDQAQLTQFKFKVFSTPHTTETSHISENKWPFYNSRDTENAMRLINFILYNHNPYLGVEDPALRVPIVDDTIRPKTVETGAKSASGFPRPPPSKPKPIPPLPPLAPPPPPLHPYPSSEVPTVPEPLTSDTKHESFGDLPAQTQAESNIPQQLGTGSGYSDESIQIAENLPLVTDPANGLVPQNGQPVFTPPRYPPPHQGQYPAYEYPIGTAQYYPNPNTGYQ